MATLDELAKAGIAAIGEKKYDEAIARFTEALAIDPSRPDLTNALGMAYLHRGEVGTALPHLERAVSLAEPFTAPEHQAMKRQFHLALATVYELLDRAPDARCILEGAVQRWPDALEPRLHLGQALLASCRVDEGIAIYRGLADHPQLDTEGKAAAKAVCDAIVAFRESGHGGDVFLRGHAESYKTYFDEVTKDSVAAGWYAEAARMSKGADGEIRPLIPQGARKYAMQRIDIVNPADGSAASVYSEAEPMVVALNGLEPLAQLAITFPWAGEPYEVWVCTRCPWHWLNIAVQFRVTPSEGESVKDGPAEAIIGDLDQVIGDWYLMGFNGDFGDKDSGRFHYITDPEFDGRRTVSYTVDLGRAKFDAIPALLRRLSVLHEKRPIQRVVFGQARIPD
jgi:tetratricopeptide (TPR) repeat protein